MNARHLASQLVKHLAPLEIRVAKKLNNDVFVSSDRNRCLLYVLGKVIVVF